MTPKISILIPYHDAPNTAFYLSRLMMSIEDQSFKDYELVLTKEGAFARNHNAALIKAKGEIVQYMGRDDYFADNTSLQRIVDAFNDPSIAWAIGCSLHEKNREVGWPHIPYWTDDIYTGNNRLGSVSTLSMRSEKALMFEEPLQWLVDCELYYRLYLKYGLPYLHKTPTVVIDTRDDRLTSTLSNELKVKEVEYLQKKYGGRN
jgi:hypothetical protein